MSDAIIKPTAKELSLLHNYLCQALSETKRIQILYALYDQPQHVTALAKTLGFPQPTVSRHLRVLRQRSLVTTRRDGPAVIYSVGDERVIAVLEMMRSILHDHLAKQSDLLQSDFAADM
ncbi:MAG: metalloregulator ArsR/SmtB family transcription factor [Ardenticatenaceae bacterium]|nr:metalloregulator ArsR/SmtB family transcription factor [Ardenticatenaceae bacterium]